MSHAYEMSLCLNVPSVHVLTGYRGREYIHMCISGPTCIDMESIRDSVPPLRCSPSRSLELLVTECAGQLELSIAREIFYAKVERRLYTSLLGSSLQSMGRDVSVSRLNVNRTHKSRNSRHILSAD